MAEEKEPPNPLILAIQREIELHVRNLNTLVIAVKTDYQDRPYLKIQVEDNGYNNELLEINFNFDEGKIRVNREEILLENLRPVRLAIDVARYLDVVMVARTALFSEIKRNPHFAEDLPSKNAPSIDAAHSRDTLEGEPR